jgi:hypothetical protein
VVGISRLSGGGEIPRPSGGDIEVNWWGELSRSSGGGNYQGQVVGISRSTGGGNYQGQVVGISRSSSGDIKAKWWGYQGQGEGLRGQGKKKVVGGACPLQLPLLRFHLSQAWWRKMQELGLSQDYKSNNPTGK